jgi:hypothetical protein
MFEDIACACPGDDPVADGRMLIEDCTAIVTHLL